MGTLWYNIRGERKEGYTVKESEVKRMPNTAELAIEKAEKAKVLEILLILIEAENKKQTLNEVIEIIKKLV